MAALSSLPAIAKLSGGESGLHHGGKQQRPDHETCGRGTLRLHVQERTIRDQRAGGGQHQADDEARQCLGASVTVGMIGIGGKGGQGESQQDEAGGENVGGRFQSVGHHGGGMAHDSGDDFDHGKRAADGHAGNGDSLPDLHSTSSVVEFRGTLENRYRAAPVPSPLLQYAFMPLAADRADGRSAAGAQAAIERFLKASRQPAVLEPGEEMLPLGGGQFRAGNPRLAPHPAGVGSQPQPGAPHRRHQEQNPRTAGTDRGALRPPRGQPLPDRPGASGRRRCSDGAVPAASSASASAKCSAASSPAGKSRN